MLCSPSPPPPTLSHPHALHTENMEWKGHVHLHSLKDDCPVMDCVVKSLLLRLQNLIIMHYLLIINFLLNLYLAFCAAASQCNSPASRHRPRSTAPSVVAVVIIILDKNNNKFAKKSGHGPQHDDESRCGGFLGVIWHNCTKSHLDLFSPTLTPPPSSIYIIISIV